MRILGAILAGGQSRRFGSDKALARWRSRPLIEHAIGSLRPHVEEIAVCGRAWPGATCLPDCPTADLGPLGGLYAALLHAEKSCFDCVLSVPCDVPAVPASLLRRLTSHAGPAFVGDVPVIGIWPATLSGRLERHLAGGGARSIRGWADSVQAASLRLAPGERLANINRPADLLALDENV